MPAHHTGLRRKRWADVRPGDRIETFDRGPGQEGLPVRVEYGLSEIVEVRR